MIDFRDERYQAARRPIERASTLPSEAFTSTEIFRLEQDRIFAREWLCVGRVDQIPEPGCYFSIDLCDDKLVAVRDQDDTIRVLSRICRHRAAEVVEGSGQTKSFQCPYHAWTYRLDGSLLGAPHMGEKGRFDKSRCTLPEIRSEVWEGFLFVNLDGRADPLAPQLASLTGRLAPYRMSDMIAVETAVFDSPFNWKVLMDNFMEAYHHIAIHKNTLEPIYPGAQSHSPDNDGPYSLLVMPSREGLDPNAGSTLPEIGTPEEPDRSALVVGAIFPTLLFAPSASSLTWYHVLPESADRFTLRIYNCFPKETLEDPAHAQAVAQFQDLIRVIHNEDIVACETTWRGLQARSYAAGVLSPLEKPIWQFNQWWLDRMEKAD